jgi:steroid delta-isomerase
MGGVVQTSAFLLGAMVALASALPAAAGPAEDIRARLEDWTAAFNAGEKDSVCDLFSKGAIATFRGEPERGHADICDLLQRAIGDPARTYRYELAIGEIIVEGDLAVVRRTFTLFIAPPGVTTVEPGMDVFRKEADGAWRIVRSLAYAE